MERSIEEIAAELRANLPEMPRTPGVSWPMAISVAILRTLEKQHPGFMEATRQSVLDSAAKMEASGDKRMVEDAPSMRELAASWVFTESPSAD